MSLSLEPAASPWFRLATISGKGIGVVATRDILRGTLLIAELPLIAAPYDASIEELERQYISLSVEQQATFISLHNAHPELAQVRGIFQTNTISVDSSPDAMSFVLPTISRFNHSCRPTAMFSYQEPYEKVYALVDIPQGAEICVGYGGSAQSAVFEERQQYYHRVFGFWCDCSACSAAPERRAQSDAHMLELRALEDVLADWSQLDPQQAILVVKRCLDIFDMEDINSDRGSTCWTGFEIACRAQWWEIARFWLHSAWGWQVIERLVGELVDSH